MDKKYKMSLFCEKIYCCVIRGIKHFSMCRYWKIINYVVVTANGSFITMLFPLLIIFNMLQWNVLV